MHTAVPQLVCRPVLEACLLGGCTLRYNGVLLPQETFRRRRAFILLLLLLITPDHRLPRESVVEVLWPEGNPDGGVAGLHKIVGALREVLRGRSLEFDPLINRADSVALHPDLVLVSDAGRFEDAALAALRDGDLAAMRMAAALYTGDLLPALPNEEWTIYRREELARLEQRLLRVLAGNEARTDPESAEERLRTLLRRDPTDEPSARVLMRLLAERGRRAEALRVYHDLARALRDDLDVQPAVESRALYRRLVRLQEEDEQAEETPGAEVSIADALPGRTGDLPATNLPAPVSSFIGREREIAAVRRLLGGGGDVRSGHASRLVTLTGPGGMGKTRLALAAASELADQYPDGVWFVELAPIVDPSLVPSTVAQVLGVREEPGRALTQTLADHLKDKQLLAGARQLRAGGGGLCRAGDDAAGGCSGTAGAGHQPGSAASAGGTAVSGLPAAGARPPLPALEALSQYEAVRLFIARARSVQPDFTVTNESAPAVAEICARLDGLAAGHRVGGGADSAAAAGGAAGAAGGAAAGGDRWGTGPAGPAADPAGGDRLEL